MKCIFCDFASSKTNKHKNKYPFIKLHQTKHTFSFLSIDFIAHEDGHIIVTPNKHFKYFEELPKNILHDLSEHLSLAIRVTRKNHDGCNILLNDGKFAEQTVPHVHFHVIPRDKKDKIHIEPWKRKSLSLAKFKQLSSNLKKEFKRTKSY